MLAEDAAEKLGKQDTSVAFYVIPRAGLSGSFKEARKG